MRWDNRFGEDSAFVGVVSSNPAVVYIIDPVVHLSIFRCSVIGGGGWTCSNDALSPVLYPVASARIARFWCFPEVA